MIFFKVLYIFICKGAFVDLTFSFFQIGSISFSLVESDSLVSTDTRKFNKISYVCTKYLFAGLNLWNWISATFLGLTTKYLFL